MAAQIVTGIGFLGAGVIIRQQEQVVGVTTAAGIWVCTAIGMAAASGLYLIALLVTLISFAALQLRGLSRR